MANVVDLAAHRKKLSNLKTAYAPRASASFEELVYFCIDEITNNWERFACNNRLNDYFISDATPWTSPGKNYLIDLNAIALIESKINLSLELCSPGINGSNQVGWVAAFKLNDKRVMTPFMMSEAYARCFNILLFLKLGRELAQHGIPIT